MRILKVVFRIIHNSSHFCHNDGSKGVAADIYHGTEAVEEPVDGNNDGVHASDGYVDGACESQSNVDEGRDGERV